MIEAHFVRENRSLTSALDVDNPGVPMTDMEAFRSPGENGEGARALGVY